MPVGEHLGSGVDLLSDDIAAAAVLDEVIEMVVEQHDSGDRLDIEEPTPPERYELVVVDVPEDEQNAPPSDRLDVLSQVLMNPLKVEPVPEAEAARQRH